MKLGWLQVLYPSPVSLLAQERGLKLDKIKTRLEGDVAPRAGAWIETTYRMVRDVTAEVAPRAGA